MQDVMVDLETLGNSAGCAILSIGAVAFDPETGEMGEEFYSVISVASCVVAGLRFDQDTLEWWGKQSPEARAVLKQAYAADAPPLKGVLHEFARYMHKATAGKAPKFWGNGASFDDPILTSAYRVTGIKQPWAFWDSRCYRTLKNECPDVPLPPRVGTFHNALDDAKTQAVHALQIFRHKQALLETQEHVDRKAEPVTLALSLDETDLPLDAISNLIENQKQLDADGVMVGVSRQALDEVLAALRPKVCIPRFFHHPESSCLMRSDSGCDMRGGDGLVEEIDEAEFNRLKAVYMAEEDDLVG